jgi:hypothetical protein
MGNNKVFLMNPNFSRLVLPKAPPLHEEPSQGMPSKEVCEICGKTFKTHTQPHNLHKP